MTAPPRTAVKEENKQHPLDLLDVKRKEEIRNTLDDLFIVDDVIGIILQFSKQEKILVLLNLEAWTFDPSTHVWKQHDLPMDLDCRSFCRAFLHGNQLVTLALPRHQVDALFKTVTLDVYSGCIIAMNEWNRDDHVGPIKQHSKGMMHAKFWDSKTYGYRILTYDVLQSQWNLDGFSIRFKDFIFCTPDQNRIYVYQSGIQDDHNDSSFFEYIDLAWKTCTVPTISLWNHSCYTIHKQILYICGFFEKRDCLQYDMIQDKWTILPPKKYKGSLRGDIAIVIDNILYCIADQHMESYDLSKTSSLSCWQELAPCPDIFNYWSRNIIPRIHTIL